MDSRAWALILFTLLIQTAVGILIAGLVVGLFWRTVIDQPAMMGIMKMHVITCGVLLVLGMIVSNLHLGNPSRAIYAIRNLRTSWLSREIVLVVILTVLVWLWIVLASMGIFSWHNNHLFSLGLCILGLTLVTCMTCIYRLRTVPVWNSILTVLDFFIATLLLGQMGFLAVSVFSGIFVDTRWEPTANLICFLILLLALTRLVIIPFEFIHRVKTGNTSVSQSKRVIPNLHYLLCVLLLTASVVGIILVLVLQKLSLIYPLLIIIPVTEIIGRYQFYRSYKCIGL